jgi:hypothetical protein
MRASYWVFLLLMASCDTHSPAERERDYQAAVATASTQPTYPLAGTGLRFGVTTALAKRRADSLRQHDEFS